MSDIFDLDATDLAPRPALDIKAFDPGSHRAAHDSAAGQAIFGFYTSRFGVALLIGAIIAAPSRPPVVTGEPFVARLVGDHAFADPLKQYTGRLVRWIVEQLGGRWVRSGAKITVASRYKAGSIYTFRPAEAA